jgi:hypothetical protein
MYFRFFGLGPALVCSSQSQYSPANPTIHAPATIQEFQLYGLPMTGLSSGTKCNTPTDLIIGTDQDVRECCHAMLFAFVG